MQPKTRREFLEAAAGGAAWAAIGLGRTSARSAEPASDQRTLSMRPTGPEAKTAPVMGISEWMCWYAHKSTWDNVDQIPGSDQPEAIDKCIDVHEAVGVDHLVWNCGRSTLDYHSELPNTTRTMERSDLVAGRSWAFVARVMNECCPLRRAIGICRQRRLGIYGRLGMNRHYGGESYASVTSRFASDHFQWHERGKKGGRIASRLCYAIPEVQQERIDILLEIQRIGVDGLVLDFCRQMPMLGYHDALTKPYVELRGVDPRTIDSTRPDDYQDWFQYRADVLTGFMKKLRRGVRKQEATLGRPCPVIARVPASAPWLMIAYGLDIERWFKDDLIDGTMLSPFVRCRDDLNHYPEYHATAAHDHGKICIGGIGSRMLLPAGDFAAWKEPSLRPVYELALRQYDAGVDAMSLYQSEMLARMPYVQPTLREIGDKAAVRQRIAELPEYTGPNRHLVGTDWHSQPAGVECLSVEQCGNNAL